MIIVKDHWHTRTYSLSRMRIGARAHAHMFSFQRSVHFISFGMFRQQLNAVVVFSSDNGNLGTSARNLSLHSRYLRDANESVGFYIYVCTASIDSVPTDLMQ